METQEISLATREAGDIGTCTVLFCDNDTEILEALRISAAAECYQNFKKTNPVPEFPAVVLWYIEISEKHRQSGHGRNAVLTVLSHLKKEGVRCVFLKAMYSPGPDWEIERAWREKFYMSAGFTRFSDESIRPLMYRSLVDPVNKG